MAFDSNHTGTRDAVSQRVFWICAACACLAYGLLVIPNYDDGNYFFHLYNTIGLRNPFYNDFYGQYFHFMKPLVLLYALLLSGIGAPDFRILALTQSIELLVCLRLAYLCIRRYASEPAALAGTGIFFYLLVAQWALSPLRPEITVVLCCLATFWLCERYGETGSLAWLIGASAVAFLAAAPMHTCGAIPAIYLLLFTAASRRRLSGARLAAFGALSAVFAAAGAAFLIYPGIQSFAASLALFSFDGNRFSGPWGEVLRIRQFVADPAITAMLLFVLSVVLAAAISCYGRLRPGLKRHRNTLLYLAGAAIGLGVLPSAAWEVYTVYYYLPLVMAFAVACDVCSRRAPGPLLPCALLAAGALSWWSSFNSMPAVYGAVCAGAFALATAAARRITPARLAWIVLVPLLLYHGLSMSATGMLFGRAKDRIEKAAGAVLGGAWFVFYGSNVVAVNGSWCGAKTQVRAGTEGAVIEFSPVARERADLISGHPLVRAFGQNPGAGKTPPGSSRRSIGETLYGLSSRFCNTTKFLNHQDPPLRFEEVRKEELSSELLDTYANPVVRGLQFVEYRIPRGTGPGEEAPHPKPSEK